MIKYFIRNFIIVVIINIIVIIIIVKLPLVVCGRVCAELRLVSTDGALA